jgi:hypothetical protein
MPFAQDINTPVASTPPLAIDIGVTKDVTYTRMGGGGTSRGAVIEVAGHHIFSLQTKQVGAAVIVVKLQGSNDGVAWTDLITNTHAGNDSQFGTADAKPWKFVSVFRSTDGAGTSDYFLRCSGFSGPF